MKNTMNAVFEKVDYSSDFSILLHMNHTNENYALHWHPAIELIMPISNTYNVIINKHSFHLEESDILIIPPGELHELIAPQSGRRMILLIDYSLISNLKGMSSILPLLRHPIFINNKLDFEIHHKIEDLLFEISEEYNDSNYLWEAAVYSKLIQILLLIGRNNMYRNNIFPDSKQNKQKEYIEKFDIIFEYIHNNYTQEIDLDTIAGIAGFSKFHFSRLFKQFTDMSFYDYLNKERIQAAERLLLKPDLPITEVAFQSGFSSISTFNRVFKTIKKCTPSEFRALYDNEHN